MKDKARKAFLAAIGIVFRVGKIANFTAGKFEELVGILVKDGEMNEPKAREFVRKSMDVLHEEAEKAQAFLEERVKAFQAEALQKINRLAREAVKATNSPRKKPPAKKKSSTL